MRTFVITYLVVVLIWMPVSYLWWPWEPHTRRNRLSGAFIQSWLWPLAAITWVFIWRDEDG